MKTLVLLFVFCLLGGTIYATQHTIMFASFSYNPSSLTVQVGDTITWTGSFPSHPLSSTSVPAGAATFSNSTGTTFSYKVTVEGNYAYKCDFHASSGMTGSFTAIGTSSVDDEIAKVVLFEYSQGALVVELLDPMVQNTYTVTMTNVLGQTIAQTQIGTANRTVRFDLHSQPNGILFIMLRDERGFTFLKKLLL